MPEAKDNNGSDSCERYEAAPADNERLQRKSYSKDMNIENKVYSGSKNENIKDLSHNEQGRPLRESSDIPQLYDSVSLHSTKTHNESKKAAKEHRTHWGNGRESPRVIPNSFSYFNRGDKQEMRYKNDEEEEIDNRPYREERNSSVREPRNSQNFNSESFQVPNKENELHGGDDPSRQKFIRKFQIFGKRRNRDRKRSVAPPFKSTDGDDDDDIRTGERAQHLIATLNIGSPAINILASCLLEDEHGITRSPLLLTLLGIKVTGISSNLNTKVRRFRIDLEYGVGPQRMRWSVEKTAKDLLYLHSKFKLDNWRSVSNKNAAELPKYPIPPLLYRDGKYRSNPHKEEDYPITHDDTTGNNQGTLANDIDSHPSQHDNISLFTAHTFREQFANLRTHISNLSSSSGETSADYKRSRIQKNHDYIRDVNKYLNDLVQLVSLKPQSNRLFQFFELSPISSLLSYETGYSGKQGIIHIGGTAKSQGWRVGHFKANDLKGMIDRRSEKWCLIRNSYVMYVSDINSTSPLEVFLVDSNFRINYRKDHVDAKDDDDSDYDDSSLLHKKLADIEEKEKIHKRVFKHLRISLENSERKLILVPKSHREQKLWIESLNIMKNSTIWSEKNRFGSFAPIRQDCFAQWFVDGRDYFWAVSSAIEMAKDVIFIHDWWLSPELYLRRPANGNQQWRIDRLLQRKAQQGVKIFVIIYRNVGTTVATDSLYTKHSLLSLHENIHVIRSPNQLLQNTYFWAHHEKLCMVDQTVAFLGGIDLCYGRFDTPDHVLVDDSKVNFESLDPNERFTSEDLVKFQVFPGKDYSNPRVKDFFALDKPYESMYDRSSVPRMPWHDVHMVTSGKIARDLSRHFVQRWNYLIRQKRPSRYTPLLTPPPDMTDEEVKALGLEGTCQVQLLRSSGHWSLGLKDHEQSIQNAYLKLIETSEHFVYIENQFFVTSCFIDGNEIHNRIGDALVDRIIRAYNEGSDWRAVIVIPLMPGFESQVDEPDGSSVRVIMQCQFMSISRGSTSIFAKLRKYGIDPNDYIQFFSLRKWGRIGPSRTLVTEQLYIHAKTMVVDDRAAIIGSANINERSMRGLRDSEVAAVVQDKETVSTTMNGKPYLAGKFSHTLRMRLMREHLGVNVDILDIVERRFKRFENFAKSEKGIEASTSHFKHLENIILSAMVELASRDILNQSEGTFRWKNFRNKKNLDKAVYHVPLDDIKEHEELHNIPSPLSLPVSFSNRTGSHEANKGIRDRKKHSYDARVQHNEHHKTDVYGEGLDKYKSKLAKKARLSSTKLLKEAAQKTIYTNPAKVTLPDLDSVVDFLHSDDFVMVDEMDEESEKIISERNKERWLLLKKISYLQRVSAKENDDAEVEAKKRVEAGFDPQINLQQHNDATNISIHDDQLENTDNSMNAPLNGTSNNDSSSRSSNSLPEKKQTDSYANEMSEDIPIIKLSEESARSVINDIESRGVKNFANFTDPYLFEDPLNEEFYEDAWQETARRNSEIFRLVFHTQPDNAVESWKDYKHFSKLNSAFKISQQHEAKYRKSNSSRTTESISDDSDSDEDEQVYLRPGLHKTSTEAKINVKKLEQDVGLLGHAPPAVNNTMDTVTSEKYSQKAGRRTSESKDVLLGVSKKDSNYDAENDSKNEKTTSEDLHNLHEPPRSDTSNYLDDRFTSANVNEGGAMSAQQINKKTRRKRNTFAGRRRPYLGDKIFERDSAERLLREVRGHLVMFPVDWLVRELEAGNWFYNTDRIPPIDIYD